MDTVKMEKVLAKAPPKSAKYKPIAIERNLVPTPAYDTFWKFAAERQNIFVKQFQGIGNGTPLTNDPILQVHKFTCSGQVKLATVLESFQYKRSDSFGVNPPLY